MLTSLFSPSGGPRTAGRYRSDVLRYSEHEDLTVPELRSSGEPSLISCQLLAAQQSVHRAHVSGQIKTTSAFPRHADMTTHPANPTDTSHNATPLLRSARDRIRCRCRTPCALLLVAMLATCTLADPSKRSAPYPRQPRHGDIYVIAHRGAHQNIPENTLAAYQKAIDLGADFVEIDLRTTKDGEFVSIHNKTVDAYLTDGTKGRVRDFTLAEIKQFDIGSRINSEWSDERVPTFDEILKLCKDQVGIYLDLKDAPVDRVARRILDHDMQQQVVWCVSPTLVAEIRRVCPTCIPMPDPESEESLPDMLRDTTPTIVAPVWNEFSSTFSEKCHKTGAIVFVDELKPDPANWQQAIDWNADGIQTDAPETLIEFLRSRR